MDGLTPEENKQMLLSVGTHRGERMLTPVEAAKLFRKSISSGGSITGCATGTHVTTSMVSRFLKLLDLIPEIQHLVDWGASISTISFTSAFELSRLAREDQQEVANAILEDGFSAKEVRDLVQLRRRSGSSVRDCIEATLKMRRVIVRRFVFVGAVTESRVHQHLEGMQQSDRDSLMREIAVEDLNVDRNVEVRLGPSRFTLVGNDAVAKSIDRLSDFEIAVNGRLAERIK